MSRLLTWVLRLLPILGLALVAAGSQEWYPKDWLDSEGFVINLASTATSACFGLPIAAFVLQKVLRARQIEAEGNEAYAAARDRLSKFARSCNSLLSGRLSSSQLLREVENMKVDAGNICATFELLRAERYHDFWKARSLLSSDLLELDRGWRRLMAAVTGPDLSTWTRCRGDWLRFKDANTRLHEMRLQSAPHELLAEIERTLWQPSVVQGVANFVQSYPEDARRLAAFMKSVGQRTGSLAQQQEKLREGLPPDVDRAARRVRESLRFCFIRLSLLSSMITQVELAKTHLSQDYLEQVLRTERESRRVVVAGNPPTPVRSWVVERLRPLGKKRTKQVPSRELEPGRVLIRAGQSKARNLDRRR